MTSTIPLLVKLVVATVVIAALAGLVSLGGSTLDSGSSAVADAEAYGLNLADGRTLFLRHCTNCHTLDDSGAGGQGPNLHNLGVVAATRKPDMSAAEYILESIIDPGAYRAPGVVGEMPQNIRSNFYTEALRNLVAFLAAQGSQADFAEIAALPIPEGLPMTNTDDGEVFRVAQIERGAALFRGEAGCSDCHMLAEGVEFTVIAPSVASFSRMDPESLRRSILDPSAEITAGYEPVLVGLADGSLATGRLLEQNEESITLLEYDERGRLHARRIAMSEIDHEDGAPMIKHSDISMMPLNYEDLLDDEDLEALMAFIRALG